MSIHRSGGVKNWSVIPLRYQQLFKTCLQYLQKEDCGVVVALSVIFSTSTLGGSWLLIRLGISSFFALFHRFAALYREATTSNCLVAGFRRELEFRPKFMWSRAVDWICIVVRLAFCVADSQTYQTAVAEILRGCCRHVSGSSCKDMQRSYR